MNKYMYKANIHKYIHIYIYVYSYENLRLWEALGAVRCGEAWVGATGHRQDAWARQGSWPNCFGLTPDGLISHEIERDMVRCFGHIRGPVARGFAVVVGDMA